jgi:acetylornithine deacetylase/succinyl-diaminopimelate desuccinylase-like protein
MPYHDDGDKIFSPGVADDTASVVVLMMMAKFFIENNITPKNGIMFVCNSCEEGLGNLKGTRKLFESMEDKIEYLYSFDSSAEYITNKSVGSHRYKITAITEGGHSFGAFGNRNAINVLAKIITEIYKIEVPSVGDSRTTYNVGVIEGGTSVNTIAESASMLCEYRSDSMECLDIMKKRFFGIFEEAKKDCIELKIELVGDRPCMSADMDREKLREISDRAKKIQEKHFGKTVTEKSGSTDCNVPHSLSVPAVALSNYDGGGEHTVGEWVYKESFKPGLRVSMELILIEGGRS